MSLGQVFVCPSVWIYVTMYIKSVIFTCAPFIKIDKSKPQLPAPSPNSFRVKF